MFRPLSICSKSLCLVKNLYDTKKQKQDVVKSYKRSASCQNVNIIMILWRHDDILCKQIPTKDSSLK